MSLFLFPINTKRMYLLPATVKLYLLELHDRKAFASALNAHVPEEWPPDQINPEVIQEFIGQMQARDRKIWSFYWILRPEDTKPPVLMGNGGFLAHDNETLVIGYSLLPGYHGNGYATEAVQSLVKWAFSNLKRYRIIAYTYPHLKASIRVLEKNGFFFKGNSQEEGIIVYELLNGAGNSKSES
ncbi:MAG: GNAT family N-acetyltransferase [Methanosarcina sp.]